MRPALRRHAPSRVSTGRTLDPNRGQGIIVFDDMVIQISDRWRRCDERDVGIRVNATAYSTPQTHRVARERRLAAQGGHSKLFIPSERREIARDGAALPVG